MNSKITKSWAEHRKDIAKRNEIMYQEYRAGAGTMRLAGRYEMTQERVRQIIKEKKRHDAIICIADSACHMSCSDGGTNDRSRVFTGG